ncbi:hypothetical protein FCV25MIE_28672 [Fagus crenata]
MRLFENLSIGRAVRSLYCHSPNYVVSRAKSRACEQFITWAKGNFLHDPSLVLEGNVAVGYNHIMRLHIKPRAELLHNSSDDLVVHLASPIVRSLQKYNQTKIVHSDTLFRIVPTMGKRVDNQITKKELASPKPESTMIYEVTLLSLTEQCHYKSREQNLQSIQQCGSSKEKSGLILYLDNQMSMGVYDQECLELSIKLDIEAVHYLVKT